MWIPLSDDRGARARRCGAAHHGDGPDKVFFSGAGGDEARPGAVLPRGRRAAPCASRRAADAHAALPPRRRGSPSSRSASRRLRRSGSRRRSSGRRTGRPRVRSSSPTWRTSCGRSTGLPRLPRVAVPSRPSPVADELRLDLDPQPGVEFDEVREAAGEVRRPARRARNARLPEDDREPRPARLRPARAALGLVPGARGGRRRRP